MNPLSPFTYYRRHKQSALLLVVLISLATLGVCVMVRLLDALAEQAETSERYLTRFSKVSAIGPALEPGVVSQIQAHPDVARAIPERSLYIGAPMNTSGGFRLFGASESDLQFLIDTCDLRLKEGRSLRPRTNELLLSEELADALGLRIGDRIGRSINEDYYWVIPTTMELVGILESTPSTDAGQRIIAGFVSYEYVDSHGLYTPRSSLLVVAQTGRKAEVDRFLETTIASPRADVMTYDRLSESLSQGLLYFHVIFGVVDCLAATVIALVVGTINWIGVTQRIEDFGLLHAIGHGTNWLVRRLAVETIAVAGVGWIGGLAFSWLLFAWLKVSVFPPTMELNLTNLTPIWFSVPIPLAVIAFVMFSIMRTLARFDAVTIIERGKPSTEPSDRRRVVKRSSASPLSSWTFYLRHRRQGLALAVTMALMILGVAFPMFLFSPMLDANKLLFEHLRYVSVVSPRAGDSIDPGVTAQIRTHPAVARVVPAVRLRLLLSIPPINQNPTSIYCVPEEDLQALINLYGVRVEEGRLPHPRTNEIVLSSAVAMNRGLQVRDKIGRPAYELDYGIPTEMVMVGILSRPGDSQERVGDVWSGFASYEYLRSHELYSTNPVSLLVIPTDGHKSELDEWLEKHVASEQTAVRTYETQLSRHRQDTLILLLLFGIVESIIAVVAAVALAVLSYTFFTQRREEFGILHAMGCRRLWLVLRTAGETTSVVIVAWLIGAAVCMAGLAYLQVGLYAPKGLTLNFFNPVPWLFTLPTPLAVVAVSTGLVAWMLSRLDPVSIIERRS